MQTTRFFTKIPRIRTDVSATRRFLMRRRVSRVGAGALAILLIVLAAVPVFLPRHAVQGTVRDSMRVGLPGVTLVFQGTGEFLGSNHAIRTDGRGAYARRLPEGWTGRLLIDCDPHVDPVERSIAPLTGKLTDQDFAVFPQVRRAESREP